MPETKTYTVYSFAERFNEKLERFQKVYKHSQYDPYTDRLLFHTVKSLARMGLDYLEMRDVLEPKK